MFANPTLGIIILRVIDGDSSVLNIYIYFTFCIQTKHVRQIDLINELYGQLCVLFCVLFSIMYDLIG